MKQSSPAKGEMAPEFEATLVDGQPFSLKQLRGNYILLDFWGSWCLPCRRQNPGIVALYEKFKERHSAAGEGFEVVTIALEKEGDAWKKAAEKDGFSWPWQIVEYSQYVMMSDLARLYGVTDIPAKFMIYPDGSLHPEMNFNEIEALLEAELKE
ncbi:MAG: TlpA family protein disulfide reductase [Bacteroidia bacterium]|nr:TlpA family protein disulfide reductase [Bacteroidia bacterium]